MAGSKRLVVINDGQIGRYKHIDSENKYISLLGPACGSF